MSFPAPNVTALWSSLAPYRFVILSASAFILLFVFANSYRKRLSSQRLPFATLEGQDPLESWFKDGNKLIEEGLRRYAGPFQIQTGTGAKVIVRNCNTEAFAKSPAMSVAEALRLDSFADYPGFEAARVSVHSSVIRDTLLRRLTPALDILRPNLVKDAVNSIAHNFGDHDTWATVPIQPLILDIVTKVSSRPFVGDYLCEDPKWLEIQKQYAGLSFTAASELRKCTALFRPIKHWFLPSCVVLRQLVQDARVLVASELKRRGQSEKESNDAISWLQQEARLSKVKVDVVAAQLQLSMVAIQTTSHILCHAVQHICQHKTFIEPLRREIVAVISEHGWTKAGLYHLKLMDDFLKESLRIAQGRLAMARVCTSETVFADGSVVPKGAGCMLEANFQDSTLYSQPDIFDLTRFARLREREGKAQSWQYVSTSARDLAFGYGIHTCPGRFFAANVVKIALAHLLMEYDWSLGDDAGGETELETESIRLIDPEMRVSFKKIASIRLPV
ncbi:hypothetical protein CKM354_000758100 [Cercospora kikuchii]|uniref:Cytochrome P450 monooxygenase n=1 Tax=Cercospora kikuchii TaxID=84275 RepID=A0A9P3CU44_9PEZI|nr:uncharacterized protein CKM354_000758100 [Cercospora kikuchii]GIZ44383.1 hypothetical protein CKM354_000758100 [Cercospora kikuchii]